MSSTHLPPGPALPFFSPAHARAGVYGVPHHKDLSASGLADGGIWIAGLHGDDPCHVLAELYVQNLHATLPLRVGSGIGGVLGTDFYPFPAVTERPLPSQWASVVFHNPWGAGDAVEFAYQGEALSRPGRLFSTDPMPHPGHGELPVRLASAGNFRDGVALDDTSPAYDVVVPVDIRVDGLNLYSLVRPTAGTGTVTLDVLIAAPGSDDFTSVLLGETPVDTEADMADHTLYQPSLLVSAKARMVRAGGRIRFQLACGSTVNACDLVAGLVYTVTE